MYDVAVVGAGPAGSTAAKYLSQMGIRTCLIDKDTFPRDKPCGGGFAQSILDNFPYLRRRQQEFLQGVAKVGVLHSPNRRIALRGRIDMALALRYDFDNVLYESALETGSEAMTGHRAKSISIDNDSVKVQLAGGREVEAKVLIGADGPTSMIARETGLHKRWSPTQITPCRVAEIPARESEILDRFTSDLEYHFFANLGGMPGYGWIFPKRETINVGLGVVGNHSAGLPRRFKAFISHLKQKNLLPPDVNLSHAKGALVPTGGPIKNTVSDRCLLVGDSAGMVSPLTGGGIAYAMEAGRIASIVVRDAMEANDTSNRGLQRYQEIWKYKFGDELSDQLLAQRIFTGPFTDLLFEIGSRDIAIQRMVSEAMAESSEEGINIPKLVARTLLVCLRGAFGL